MRWRESTPPQPTELPAMNDDVKTGLTRLEWVIIVAWALLLIALLVSAAMGLSI